MAARRSSEAERCSKVGHGAAVLAAFLLLLSCQRRLVADESTPRSAPPAASGAAAGAPSTGGSLAPTPPRTAIKVELSEQAMGTSLHFVAYTNPSLDEAGTGAALRAALREMRRLEALLSEWRADSEVSRVNLRGGDWVSVGPETLDVIRRALWAGKVSHGTFDITFQAMSGLWRFGSAGEDPPRLPEAKDVAAKRRLVDYRRVELDAERGRVRIGAGQALGLGGVAKGYIVDRAVRVLRERGLSAFLVQAGGDLYGAGRKPDGSRWVSGIQDPRGKTGEFFASIELEDRAFSTAGDYARAYVVAGKRYHHIIDPRTGYPATASRSVTVWAMDATTADVVDDAVFILGPSEGLKLADSIEGVGVVIVDAQNAVQMNDRLKGRVRVLKLPTQGI